MKRHPGNDRIAAQGQWLLNNPSPVVPEVYRVYAESYVMERLCVPPIPLLNHHTVLRTMIGQLQSHIWSKSAVMPCNHDMLFEKIKNLIERYNFGHIWAPIYRMHTQVDWAAVPRCLTHGDPTFENVMIRENVNGGELVLIDPIPATLIVPDFRCVDVGKILQSALGWEAVRYGDERQLFLVEPPDVVEALVTITSDTFTQNEWHASIFWCVVHLLRTLPYVDNAVQPGVRRLISDAIALL